MKNNPLLPTGTRNIWRRRPAVVALGIGLSLLVIGTGLGVGFGIGLHNDGKILTIITTTLLTSTNAMTTIITSTVIPTTTATIQSTRIITNRMNTTVDNTETTTTVGNDTMSIITTPITASILTTTTTTTIIDTTMIATTFSTGAQTTITGDSIITATCAPGYSISPLGMCVNLQIDFNNCGSFSFVCASNYTSCAAGVCSNAPAVQLVGAIAVPNWGGQNSVDDAFQTINLPLNITLYNYSTPNVSVTTNGVICLGSCSSVYSNENLPASSFSGPTAFGYWDDLYIYANTAQTIYYAVNGAAPNRITTFEFYESHFGQPTAYYHFQILFYENQPGIVQCKYFQSSDGGVSATIGVQASSSGPSMTYSVNQANSVTTNLTLTFDTNNGTFTG